jgi:hypothetical protein
MAVLGHQRRHFVASENPQRPLAFFNRRARSSRRLVCAAQSDRDTRDCSTVAVVVVVVVVVVTLRRDRTPPALPFDRRVQAAWTGAYAERTSLRPFWIAGEREAAASKATSRG